MNSLNILVTGASGLVGQNLIQRLKERGYTNIVAIDKHLGNTKILRRLHPDIKVIEADLSKDDGWQDEVAAAEILILAHAQIGGLDRTAFTANNVTATERVITAARSSSPFVIHLSSSVVESAADDWYTQSKHAQEELVVHCGLSTVVLRPTLMFGWFDRKHLGWLSRFMCKFPIFPIPGTGRYLRQPLYVRDFCDIIIACIDIRPAGNIFNISGQERIDYIDLIRILKRSCGARAAIIRIPYSLFWMLLYVYGLVNRNPPFTTQQLEALVTPDVFEVIDWPRIFSVKATPLETALAETYNHPVNSNIVLDF